MPNRKLGAKLDNSVP